MELKNSLIKCLLAFALIFILASAYALVPTKKNTNLAKVNPTSVHENEINIHAEKYQVIKSNPECHGWCNATLKAGDYQIELHYNIIDGEVEQIDDVKASINGEEVKNIYIDRFEYSKISSAMSNSI